MKLRKKSSKILIKSFFKKKNNSSLDEVGVDKMGVEEVGINCNLGLNKKRFV